MRTDIACRRRLEKALSSDTRLMFNRARVHYGLSWVCGGCGKEWSRPAWAAGVRWLSVFGKCFDGIGDYVCGDCCKRLS